MFGKRRARPGQPAAGHVDGVPDSADDLGELGVDRVAALFGQDPDSAWADEESVGLPTDSIAVSPVPDDLLHEQMVRSVRFQIASPSGYYFPQVEEFVRQVASSLETWESLVHERDVAIHALRREVELQRHDVRSLRTQMEVFRVQGTALVREDGSYVTESQLSGAATAGSAVERDQTTAFVDDPQMAAVLHEQIVALELALNEAHTALEAWRVALAERDERIIELQAQVEAAAAERAAAAVGPDTAVEPWSHGDVSSGTGGPESGLTPTYPTRSAPWASPAELPSSSQAAAGRVPGEPSPVPASPVPVRSPGVASPSTVPPAGTADAPQLASHGRAPFQQEDPMSVWAPDLINAPFNTSPDDPIPQPDGVPDTAFRAR